MYDYYWTYTAAQIELMNVDAPFIAYKKRDKSNDGDTNGNEPTKESCEDAVKKWQERRKKRKFKMEEFLKGDSPMSENSQVTNNLTV